MNWKQKIKYRIFAIALWFMPLMSLMGCATPPAVINSCPIPARYDVVKTGPVDLTATDLKTHFEQEAQARHDAKTDANDFNGLHDYVKENCQ